MRTRNLLTATVVSWTTALAIAYDLDQVAIEAEVGQGPSSALLIVDFWPGNGDEDSFGFLCHFDGDDFTGLDLLDTVAAAGIGFSYAETGGFLTDIWYVQGDENYHAFTDWPASYLSYWLSVDFGENWEYSLVGPAERLLADGDTDGWLAKPGEDFDSEPVTPLAGLVGDVNCDGVVNFGDINPFVLAVSDPAGYAQRFPNCDLMNADVNSDGVVNFGDINGFVGLLGGGA